jgi:hypothetical protein
MRLGTSTRCLAVALLFGALADGATRCAQALPPCADNTINNASGGVLSIRTGKVFKVYPGTGGRTAAWLPGDKVSVCPLGGSAYEITNLRNNQAVKALRS